MKEKVVADSACLIALERIGRLEVLSALFDPVMIPPAVDQEFGIPFPWLTVERPIDDSYVTTLKMSIDDGEAEAIALAQEQKCQIILDDQKAWKTARFREIRRASDSLPWPLRDSCPS